MNFNVKISSKINENECNDNLAQSTFSTVYQTYNWQKLYHEAFGSKPVFITVTNDNGNVVGQLACLIHEKMLWEDANFLSKRIGRVFKLANSLWWYHGPIIHDKNNHLNWKTIIKDYINYKKIIKSNINNIQTTVITCL